MAEFRETVIGPRKYSLALLSSLFFANFPKERVDSNCCMLYLYASRKDEGGSFVAADILFVYLLFLGKKLVLYIARSALQFRERERKTAVASSLTQRTSSSQPDQPKNEKKVVNSAK